MQEFFKNKEKGAVIVFFALLLPLIMIMAGLAIDLGNIYAHKARLQNAADAAALAGARAFAENEETVDSHPKADAAAWDYAEEDAVNNNLKNNMKETNYSAGQDPNDDSFIYYKVELTENVPLYFLRILGDNFTNQDVSANSIASINTVVSYEETLGDELFVVKSHFDAVNSVNNPDNKTIAGQISNFFNGNIVVTDGTLTERSQEDGDAYLKAMRDSGNFQNSSQMGDLMTFFKSAAQEDNVSVEQATVLDESKKYHSDPYYQPYDIDALARYTREKFGLPEYSVKPDTSKSNWWADPNYESNWAEYKTKFTTISGDENSLKNNTISSSDLSGDYLAVTSNISNGDGNVAVKLDGTVSGSSDEPFYIYIDESVSSRLNIDVSASNGRPVRIVYMGTSEVAFNIASGTTFSGTIYAPNAYQVLVNAGGGNFEGSIIADKLTLRGDNATYTYKDYGVGGSQGGSGGKDRRVTKTSFVKLTLKPSANVQWK